MKATRNIIDGVLLGSGLVVGRWGVEGFMFRVLPWSSLIAWRHDQKQSSKSSQPGSRCRKTWFLVQRLRTGAKRHQRTRISLRTKAGLVDIRGHGEAASTNRSDLPFEAEGFDTRPSGEPARVGVRAALTWSWKGVRQLRALAA